MHDSTNVCIRCGQERIVAKTWVEEVETYAGVSAVKHSQYVCPDNSCQAEVEALLAAQKEVARQRQEEARKREEARALSRQIKKIAIA